MTDKTYTNVWDALSESPAEAENMNLRSSLMIALETQIKARGWTQMEAARRLGVSQPRISDLLRGKINQFSLDALVNMAVDAGLHVEVLVTEPT